MTIREQFQADVDEFISDLNTFATGSYLREDDKEFWEQPFDPAVLPDLQKLIEMFLDALETLEDDPGAEELVRVVEAFHENLFAFNEQHHNAVLEPEEKEELAELIFNASAATGAEEEALNQLPELE
ncbi:hypothetical protein QP027_05575 [Corynebacterium breve]|uniref:Uncharacterized protein n=1 Tax=Corynebacterium breve TaxID=3049799 RepID=A0ABY8VGQ4_9CORY|nr:hypothetical protein [Corynebacterium breve]WIM68851.1 hypothetical protein QP027_05575 [Corynebacterium breve]